MLMHARMIFQHLSNDFLFLTITILHVHIVEQKEFQFGSTII